MIFQDFLLVSKCVAFLKPYFSPLFLKRLDNPVPVSSVVIYQVLL
ncbi:hypothetical protein SPAR94_0954 [Streptococcus pneumoniae GA47373]|nr:hypothetical protein SPAR94_0954 [Streptococcus pneumoniae GA47373]